jgi:hypothetical protein
MVGHAINGKHFGFPVLYKAGNISVQLLFVFFGNQVLSVLNSEDKLQVNL